MPTKKCHLNPIGERYHFEEPLTFPETFHPWPQKEISPSNHQFSGGKNNELFLEMWQDSGCIKRGVGYP